MEILQSLPIDITGLLNDLRVEWVDSPNYRYNPNAFSKLRFSSKNIMMCCPFHSEGNPSFGVLREYPYTYNCFGCGEKGSLVSLVEYALSLPTYLHAERYIERDWVIVANETRPKIDIDNIFNEEDVDRGKVSEGSLDTFKGNIHPYLYSRGLSNKAIEVYEVGYNPAQSTICFPVRTVEGGIRFIQERSVHEKKFNNTADIYKKDILYGLYYILQAKGTVKELYLTESILDTISCYLGGLLAVSVMGRVLYKEQVELLLKKGVETVNLFLDNDSYGVSASYRSFEQLKNTPIKVNMVIYPGGRYGEDDVIKYKDPNDLLLGGEMQSIRLVPFEVLNLV